MPANVYLESLFETEARIIAENDTHAVVALCFEKDALQRFMQRNRQLLAALSDLTPTFKATTQPDKPLPRG